MSYVTLQVRGDSAANWASANPILALREMGLELDGSNRVSGVKFGDGVTAWASLPYFNPAAAGDNYQHTQASAAATWTVNHNLGYRPAVQILSAGGVEMLAEVVHSSVNQALIYFDQAATGLAICS